MSSSLYLKTSFRHKGWTQHAILNFPSLVLHESFHAADLKALFKAEYAEPGSMRRPTEEETYIYFCDFLDECEGIIQSILMLMLYELAYFIQRTLRWAALLMFVCFSVGHHDLLPWDFFQSQSCTSIILGGYQQHLPALWHSLSLFIHLMKVSRKQWYLAFMEMMALVLRNYGTLLSLLIKLTMFLMAMLTMFSFGSQHMISLIYLCTFHCDFWVR